MKPGYHFIGSRVGSPGAFKLWVSTGFDLYTAPPRSEAAREGGARHADVVVYVEDRSRGDTPAAAAAVETPSAGRGLEAVLYAGGGVGVVDHHGGLGTEA